MIRPTKVIRGKVNAAVIHEYPELENIEITPTVEDQTLKPTKYGFDEVRVKGVQSYIDEDIKPEYIVEGVDILGVVGNYKGIDTSDATVTTDDVLSGKIVYINNEKQIGTMPNNGELQFEPSDEEQTIPSGYTSGGTVLPVDITKLNDYKDCLEISESILDGTCLYTPLEYIESDGKQFIDTGYHPNGNSQYEMSYSNFSGNGCLFGAYNTGWGDGSGLFTASGDANYWFHYYTNVDTGIKSAESADIIINRGTFTVNGQTYTMPNKTFTVSYPLFIFGADVPRIEIPVHVPISMRLHKFIIKENDVVLHNFIPVVHNVTREKGLYDIITNRFLTNGGTGEFIAGPELQEVA